MFGAKTAIPETVEPYHPAWGRAEIAQFEHYERQAAAALELWWQASMQRLSRLSAKSELPGAVTANLNSELWWQAQSAALAEILQRLAVDSAQVGAGVAERQLRLTGLWDYVNPRAVAWAEAHAGALVAGITAELRATVQQTVQAAVADAESWPTLRAQLTELFPAWRAERIARTEVIRAGAQGAVAGYQASGTVRGVRWLDNQAGACDDCRALHGVMRPLGATFYQDTFGDGLPPRHPHCRCALAPVTLRDVARLPESHPLRDNRRQSLVEVTDRAAFVELPGKLGVVRVTGEQVWHWRYRHQGQFDIARAEAVLPELLARPTQIKAHRGPVYVLEWSATAYLIAPVAQGELRSLYLRNKRAVDKWPAW